MTEPSKQDRLQRRMQGSDHRGTVLRFRQVPEDKETQARVRNYE